MTKFALILAANAALWGAPAFADGPAGANTTVAAASRSSAANASGPADTSNGNRAAACSKDDPFIEYRDCVNASTRDDNAKVRMAEMRVAAGRG